MTARRIRIALGALLVAVVAVAAFVVMARDSDLPRSPLIGRAAPAVILNRFDGTGPAALATPGTISVVNFWAPWCVPCRREHRDLGALRAAWDPAKVQLVGVAFQSDLAEIATFLDEIGDGVPTVIDNDGIAAIEFGVVGVPETFLIDSDGVVRQRFAGAIDPEELQRAIDALLRESALE
jgi:cytochrome c biogenesis protein CcmG, thiol:disulfide interchange protein DsbE